VIYATLGADMRVLPSFMILALVAVLLVPILYARRRGLHRLARFLGLSLVTLATVAVASSVFRLVVLLPAEQTAQEALLNSGLVWRGRKRRAKAPLKMQRHLLNGIIRVEER
jgi:hypothetical protein